MEQITKSLKIGSIRPNYKSLIIIQIIISLLAGAESQSAGCPGEAKGPNCDICPPYTFPYLGSCVPILQIGTSSIPYCKLYNRINNCLECEQGYISYGSRCQRRSLFKNASISFNNTGFVSPRDSANSQIIRSVSSIIRTAYPYFEQPALVLIYTQWEDKANDGKQIKVENDTGYFLKVIIKAKRNISEIVVYVPGSNSPLYRDNEAWYVAKQKIIELKDKQQIEQRLNPAYQVVIDQYSKYLKSLNPNQTLFAVARTQDQNPDIYNLLLFSANPTEGLKQIPVSFKKGDMLPTLVESNKTVANAGQNIYLDRILQLIKEDQKIGQLFTNAKLTNVTKVLLQGLQLYNITFQIGQNSSSTSYILAGYDQPQDKLIIKNQKITNDNSNTQNITKTNSTSNISLPNSKNETGQKNSTNSTDQQQFLERVAFFDSFIDKRIPIPSVPLQPLLIIINDSFLNTPYSIDFLSSQIFQSASRKLFKNFTLQYNLTYNNDEDQDLRRSYFLVHYNPFLKDAYPVYLLGLQQYNNIVRTGSITSFQIKKQIEQFQTEIMKNNSYYLGKDLIALQYTLRNGPPPSTALKQVKSTPLVQTNITKIQAVKSNQTPTQTQVPTAVNRTTNATNTTKVNQTSRSNISGQQINTKQPANISLEVVQNKTKNQTAPASQSTNTSQTKNETSQQVQPVNQTKTTLPIEPTPTATPTGVLNPNLPADSNAPNKPTTVQNVSAPKIAASESGSSLIPALIKSTDLFNKTYQLPTSENPTLRQIPERLLFLSLITNGSVIRSPLFSSIFSFITKFYPKVADRSQIGIKNIVAAQTQNLLVILLDIQNFKSNASSGDSVKSYFTFAVNKANSSKIQLTKFYEVPSSKQITYVINQQDRDSFVGQFNEIAKQFIQRLIVLDPLFHPKAKLIQVTELQYLSKYLEGSISFTPILEFRIKYEYPASLGTPQQFVQFLYEIIGTKFSNISRSIGNVVFYRKNLDALNSSKATNASQGSSPRPNTDVPLLTGLSGPSASGLTNAKQQQKAVNQQNTVVLYYIDRSQPQKILPIMAPVIRPSTTQQVFFTDIQLKTIISNFLSIPISSIANIKLIDKQYQSPLADNYILQFTQGVAVNTNLQNVSPYVATRPQKFIFQVVRKPKPFMVYPSPSSYILNPRNIRTISQNFVSLGPYAGSNPIYASQFSNPIIINNDFASFPGRFLLQVSQPSKQAQIKQTNKHHKKQVINNKQNIPNLVKMNNKLDKSSRMIKSLNKMSCMKFVNENECDECFPEYMRQGKDKRCYLKIANCELQSYNQCRRCNWGYKLTGNMQCL